MLKAAGKLFNNLAKLAFELRLAINSKQMKNIFFNLGKVLSKEQTKKIIGGGTCCAHSADWGYQSCGLSKETAQERASIYAQTSGSNGYWCCDSCPQTPVI